MARLGLTLRVALTLVALPSSRGWQGAALLLQPRYFPGTASASVVRVRDAGCGVGGRAQGMGRLQRRDFVGYAMQLGVSDTNHKKKSDGFAAAAAGELPRLVRLFWINLCPGSCEQRWSSLPSLSRSEQPLAWADTSAPVVILVDTFLDEVPPAESGVGRGLECDGVEPEWPQEGHYLNR